MNLINVINVGMRHSHIDHKGYSGFSTANSLLGEDCMILAAA